MLALPARTRPLHGMNVMAVTLDPYFASAALPSFIALFSNNPPSTAADIQLRDAIKSGNMQMVAQLVNSGTVNINWVDKQNGWSFLHYAVSSSEGLNAVEYLVKAGIDIRLTNKDGQTAFELLEDSNPDMHFFAEGYAHYAGAAKWMIDKASEEIEKLVEGGFEKVGDYTAVNRWLAAGGRIFPLLGKFELQHVLHLRPESQLQYFEALFGDHTWTQEMIENGEIDLEKLMDTEVNGVKPYEFYTRLANLDGIDNESRERFQKIADILKENGAPGSEDPEEEPYEEPEAHNPQYGPPTAEWKRPPGDDRSAEDIVDQNPLLRNLGSREKRWLKFGFDGWDNGNNKKPDNPFGGIGDWDDKDKYTNDERADMAYRALKVLEHIEKYDKDGAVIRGESNNRIDGFGAAVNGEAKPNTEAGRLQDFTKYGWGTLKGGEKPQVPQESPTADMKRPPGDTRSAQQIIQDNPLLARLHPDIKDWLKNGFDWDSSSEDAPENAFRGLGDYETDADAAYRAAKILEYIEHYGPDGAVNFSDNNIGNFRIDGFFKTRGTLAANPGTEAARLQDFTKYGYGYLENFTVPVHRSDLPGHDALIKTAQKGDYAEFTKLLREAAGNHIIKNGELPSNRKDLLDNPDNYSIKQRGAAVMELMKSYYNLMGNTQYYSEYGVAYGSRLGFALNTDPEKVAEEILQAVEKLRNEEVDDWLAQAEAQAIQTVAGKDPYIKTRARDFLDDLLDGKGFEDEFVDDATTLDAMQSYLSKIAALNMAAGSNGKPAIEDMKINITDEASIEKIIEAFDTEFYPPDTLQKLIEGGMSEEEAASEMASRAALFLSFGIAPEDVSNAYMNNTVSYFSEVAKIGDLYGNILTEDGDFDEEFATSILENVLAEDPHNAIFFDADGNKLTVAQIVGVAKSAWEIVRGGAKAEDAIAKILKTPENELKGAASIYRTGVMHGVAALFTIGGIIARTNSGTMDQTTLAVTIGAGIQALGLTFEAVDGFSKTAVHDVKAKGPAGAAANKKTRLDQFRAGFNKTFKTNFSIDWFKSKGDHLKNTGKILGASGGIIVGVGSIILGMAAQNSGNDEGAAIYYAGAGASFATIPGGYAEGLAKYFQKATKVNIADDIINKISKWGGKFAKYTNIIVTLLFLGLDLYTRIIEDQKTEEYFDSFAPILEDYNITGGYDPWWDEESSPGLS